MKLKTKKAIGVLSVLLIILAGAWTMNFFQLEKENTKHLEASEQRVSEQIKASTIEANKIAEQKNLEAKKIIQIQLLDKQKKEQVEAERKAEIKAQELQQEKERQRQLAVEQRKYDISTNFDRAFIPSSNCENPTSSLRRTMCTNERRKAKIEFEKAWNKKHDQ